eukprot:1230947-Pleurochrysis_carterae.AAC.1
MPGANHNPARVDVQWGGKVFCGLASRADREYCEHASVDDHSARGAARETYAEAMAQVEYGMRQASCEGGPACGASFTSHPATLQGLAEPYQGGANDPRPGIQGCCVARDRSDGVAPELRVPGGGAAAQQGSRHQVSEAHGRALLPTEPCAQVARCVAQSGADNSSSYAGVGDAGRQAFDEWREEAAEGRGERRGV